MRMEISGLQVCGVSHRREEELSVLMPQQYKENGRIVRDWGTFSI